MQLTLRSAGVLTAVAFAAWLLPLRGAVATDALLERGAYLMNGIVACGNCHTPKRPDGHALADQELSGGFVFDAPVFRAVAPNITPDPDTGIGRWTDEQIIDAIRNGKRPGREHHRPADADHVLSQPVGHRCTGARRLSAVSEAGASAGREVNL